MKKFLKIIITIIIIIVLMIVYARYCGIKGLKVKEYKIESTKITDNYHGLKIVHLSDIHYGSTIFEQELSNIVDKINILKPDIVVLTGDLIDNKQSYDKDILINYLSKIDVTIDKYAVSGNEDIINDYEFILKESGFINIDNNYDLIYKSNIPIIISGITNEINTTLYEEYIGNLPEEEKPIYSILLTHQPDNVKELNINNYDLILSGHSHKGQINLPIIKKWFLPEGSKKYYDEYYNINNTDLYISSGLGTSNMKLRLFNKPSINFYRITKKM